MLLFEKNEQSKMKIIDCKRIASSILYSIPNYYDEYLSVDLIFFTKKDSQEKENNSYIRSLVKKVKSITPVYSYKTIYIEKFTEREIKEKLREECFLNLSYGNIRSFMMIGFKKHEQIEFMELFEDVTGVPSVFIDTYKKPSVVLAVEKVIKNTIKSKSKSDLLIIGRSDNALTFADRAIKGFNTVTVCHSKTNNLEEYCKRADVIVSFAGSPNLIKGDMVKEGTVIISVGCSFVNGKIVGDIDMDSMKDKDVWVTPTPGGIGTLTTAITALEIFNK